MKENKSDSKIQVILEKIKSFLKREKTTLALPEGQEKYVNLTNYINSDSKIAETKKVEAMHINGKPTYKLVNTKGLTWCTKERNDEFYSEWEKIQPAHNKFARYYEIPQSTYKVKPKELMGISKKVQQAIEENLSNEEVKNIVLNHIQKKHRGQNISHIMCEINSAQDVADLHKLFKTQDIEKVVESYAKSFSAMNWKYVTKEDESAFQVPTLMIMDSSCMKNTKNIVTVPYQKRKDGVDKLTGEQTMKVNDKVTNVLNSELNLENAVELLKLKNVNDLKLTKAIDEKLKDYKYISQAHKIVESDKFANEYYIVTNENKKEIQDEILNNKQLQQRLKQQRLQQNFKMDSYMAVYVEMIESVNRKTYLTPINKSNDRVQKQAGNFNREEQKNIQPMQQSFEERRRELKESLRQENVEQKKKIYPKNTIESAIQQYINAYVYMNKNGQNISPYSTLIRLGGKEETMQNHSAEQTALLNALRQSKRYEINEQASPNGDVNFYHIANNTYRKANMKAKARLYLNPNRENTFALVNEILKKMGDKPIYLKFISDERMNKGSRSEKIVIYVDDETKINGKNNESMNDVISALNEIKKEKMYLFKDCDIINPFMKKIDGVAGYAPDPKESMYKLMDGRLQPVSKSYNSFLAEAINESVTVATKEMLKNKNDNMPLYQKLEYLIQSSQDELINKVKVNLQKCQRNNPDLDISGIRKDKQKDKCDGR